MLDLKENINGYIPFYFFVFFKNDFECVSNFSLQALNSPTTEIQEAAKECMKKVLWLSIVAVLLTAQF